MPAAVRVADPAAVAEAAALLRRGGLVAFPTETVYGLGADALDPAAVARVYAAKGRPARNPLIVHVADAAAARALASAWPEAAARLAAAFWPGPLTLVLPKSDAVPDAVTAGGPTVAMRVPAHPVALELLRAAGGPLAAPSANRSGELSPTTAAHVVAALGDRVDLILDGGPTTDGVESTVLDLSGGVPRVLRPGPIPADRLRAVVGELAEAGPAGSGALPSPGLLARHYAPRTALEVAETADDATFLIDLYETAGLKVARWRPDGDPAGVMRRLYAELHALDAGGYDRIIAQLPPARPEWAAVRDRLGRAAAEE